MELQSQPHGNQLVLHDREDVLVANKAFMAQTVAQGGVVPPDASVMSWPFTRGGEFPKTLSIDATTVCMAGIQRLPKTDTANITLPTE